MFIVLILVNKIWSEVTDNNITIPPLFIITFTFEPAGEQEKLSQSVFVLCLHQS